MDVEVLALFLLGQIHFREKKNNEIISLAKIWLKFSHHHWLRFFIKIIFVYYLDFVYNFLFYVDKYKPRG